MKEEVCVILDKIAALLEIKGETFFKYSAYSKAAEILRAGDYDLKELVENNTLHEVKGIGKALNEKISEYVKTGEMTYFNKLKSEYPETLTELLKIDGLGPKRIKSLYDVLGIADIESLEKSCISGSLKEQKGFTEQGVGKILDSVKQFKSNDKYKIRNVDFDNIR